jgi:hypothetical protein
MYDNCTIIIVQPVPFKRKETEEEKLRSMTIGEYEQKMA